MAIEDAEGFASCESIYALVHAGTTIDSASTDLYPNEEIPHAGNAGSIYQYLKTVDGSGCVYLLHEYPDWDNYQYDYSIYEIPEGAANTLAEAWQYTKGNSLDPIDSMEN